MAREVGIAVIQDAVAIDVVVAGIDLAVCISIKLATVIFSIAVAISPESLVDITFIGDAIHIDIGAAVLGTRVEPVLIGRTVFEKERIEISVVIQITRSNTMAVSISQTVLRCKVGQSIIDPKDVACSISPRCKSSR